MSLQTTGTGLHSLPGKQSQENHTHTCNLSPQNQLDLHVDVAMSFQKAVPGPPQAPRAPQASPKPLPPHLTLAASTPSASDPGCAEQLLQHLPSRVEAQGLDLGAMALPAAGLAAASPFTAHTPLLQNNHSS